MEHPGSVSDSAEINGHPYPLVDQIRAIELREPKALDLPDIKDLFQRAFRESPVIDVENVFAVLKQVLGLPMTDWYVGVIIGDEGKGWNGLSIPIAPMTALFSGPSVYHFYNGGSADLRKFMIDATVEWIKKRGYDHFWANNLRPDKDAAFARLYSPAGKVEHYGSLFKVSLKD